MKFPPSTWYIDSSTSLVQLVAYSLHSLKHQHYAYVVLNKAQKKQDGDIQKEIISGLDNVTFLGFVNDFNVPKKKKIFYGYRFYNNKFPKPYLNTIPIFRAGSGYRKIYPFWKKSFTLRHGAQEYFFETVINIPFFYNFKKIIRIVFGILEFCKNGESKFMRNFGEKICIKLSYDSNIINKRHNTIEINHKTKDHFVKILKKRKIISNVFFEYGENKKTIMILPITLGLFKYSNIKVKHLYKQFIDFNLECVKDIINELGESPNILIMPHPTDSVSSENNISEYSKFINQFTSILKSIYKNVYFLGDFIPASYSRQISFEVLELIANPNFLLCCYPSTVLITSKLPFDRKYLVNFEKVDMFRRIFKKDLSFMKSVGNDYITKNLFKRIG